MKRVTLGLSIHRQEMIPIISKSAETGAVHLAFNV